MPRLFFALWPDDQTRNQIVEVTQSFEQDSIKLLKPSNLHITLEFIGEVSESKLQQLKSQASKIKAKPFFMELSTIGFWKKPAILWIGTKQQPQPLLQLVAAIKNTVCTIGLTPDQRNYTPHITFARKAKKLFNSKEEFLIKWQANSFVLAESVSTNSGVEYRILEEWTLSDT